MNNFKMKMFISANVSISAMQFTRFPASENQSNAIVLLIRYSHLSGEDVLVFI